MVKRGERGMKKKKKRKENHRGGGREKMRDVY